MKSDEYERKEFCKLLGLEEFYSWEAIYDTIKNLQKTTWQKEKPTEDGDWLWLVLWSCGCCHIDSGIAFVEYGEFMWNGNRPKGKVTAWMKINLPPKEWSEDL